MDKILRLFLGMDKASSAAGYVTLIVGLYAAFKDAGYTDFRLIVLAIGIFFVLRFMNEKAPWLPGLLNRVLFELQRQGAIVASPVAPPISQGPNMGSGAPFVDSGLQRQLEEANRARMIAENEAAGLRAELALNQQRLQEVRTNADNQIVDLSRTDPLRRDI